MRLARRETGSTETERHEDRERQQWDRVAAGWEKWWDTIENSARHVTERLLDLAEVAPGQRVLDIATGVGEPALSAAGRVGPTGRVVATDISGRMLDIARSRARTAGLTNVEFLEADVERLDFPGGSFDAVLCRWGITSLPEPANRLVEIRRMLAPAGSFATSVWDEASRPPFIDIATAVAHDVSGSAVRPEPTTGVPKGTVEDVMVRAGFADVRVERSTVVLEFASADAFTRYLVEVSPVVAALLSGQPSERRVEYRHRLARELRRHGAGDGSFRVKNFSICAAGRK